MKPTELMLGDWLEPDQCRTPTAYTSVAMITTDGVYMNEAERLFSFDELHGVILSDDILKRMGFDYDELEETYHWQKGDNMTGISAEVTLVMDDRGWMCNLYGPRCGMEIEELSLNYVHELQHAMRLVGIEKEFRL